MFSRSGGITKRQFARDMAIVSPEPCQRSGGTWGGLPCLKVAGRKWVRPGFSFMRSVSMASKKASEEGNVPERISMAGRTKRSKVTMVETGLPGRPNTDFSLQIAKTTGFPGRMATASKTKLELTTLTTDYT